MKPQDEIYISREENLSRMLSELRREVSDACCDLTLFSDAATDGTNLRRLVALALVEFGKVKQQRDNALCDLAELRKRVRKCAEQFGADLSAVLDPPSEP